VARPRPSSHRAFLPAAAQDTVTCTFHDVADSTVAPNPAPPPKTFSLVVKTPTAGEKIKLLSQTLLNESYNSNCKSQEPLTTLTALSNPALTPSVVDTYLPLAGAVNTGTTGGAATCAQPWVTIAKVPAAAQVGVTLIPDDTQYPGTFGNFTKLQIPGALYGWGPNPADQIRWYSPGAASKLLVITLRRDVCTIDGHGPIADALKILKEKIFYRADNSLSYTQLLSCFVTSGPTPGVPCIAHRKVYTKFNLPPVSDPNRLQYLGDHEWVIYAHDNGRYWN
jgi:hypothetical protein